MNRPQIEPNLTLIVTDGHGRERIAACPATEVMSDLYRVSREFRTLLPDEQAHRRAAGRVGQALVEAISPDLDEDRNPEELLGMFAAAIGLLSEDKADQLFSSVVELITETDGAALSLTIADNRAVFGISGAQAAIH